MTRQAINITITDSLQRARVSERLDALAEHTALAPTSIAARALQLGLTQIEADPSRLFPGAAQPLPTEQRPAAPQPDPEPVSHAQAGEGKLTDTTQSAALPKGPKRERAPRPAPTPSQPTASNSETADAGSSAARADTKAAALALGHPSASAFLEHVRRHRDLDAFSLRSGRALLWDLDGLRLAYDRLGFRLRGQGIAQEEPHRVGEIEPATT